MAEQTALKRTRQHVATLYSALSGPGYVLRCKCEQWEARGRHENRLREQHRAHRVEMGEWVKPRKEGPDWADLREMARNAGWTRRTMAAGLRPVTTDVWGKYPPGDKFAEVVQEGAARIGLAAHGLYIELHGPGKDQRERADLINPTPAKVLNIARELGIGGTS